MKPETTNPADTYLSESLPVTSILEDDNEKNPVNEDNNLQEVLSLRNMADKYRCSSKSKPEDLPIASYIIQQAIGKFKTSYWGTVLNEKLSIIGSSLYAISGDLKRLQSDFEEALSNLNIALRMHPGNVFAICSRADTLAAKGDFELAIAELKELLEECPDNRILKEELEFVNKEHMKKVTEEIQILEEDICQPQGTDMLDKPTIRPRYFSDARPMGRLPESKTSHPTLPRSLSCTKF